MNDKIALSTQLVQAIMNYLGTKPFNEVAQLIQSVQTEAQAQPSKMEQPPAEQVQ
jgi:hypothetical protein